jgi:hypothetical protein
MSDRVQRALQWERLEGGSVRPDPGFQTDKLPDPDISAEDLIAYRKKTYAQRNAAEQARKLIGVRVKIDGPIGITHFGDVHIDDDGCWIEKLEMDMNSVRDTEGMFGANLGDLQNNWVGRLARLWANQGTSASQSWKLVEWMINYIDWLYIIGGNHDTWSGQGDPLKWMTRGSKGVFENHGARLGLTFPNGKVVRVNARHDFAGHSQWNPAHGAVKASMVGWRDHILTCGHKHTSYISGPMKDPSSGLLSWAIRCAGYKIHDDYAAASGFPDQNAFPACVTIIDPQYADNDTRLVTVIPDVQEAAEYLTWKRAKWGQSKRTRK